MTLAMHRILVVEDDVTLSGVIATLLEAHGYRVVQAATVQRAQIEARSHQPDLVLLDLGLPDGSGLDVVRELRGYSGVPVVVLSARHLEAEKIRALDAGVDDYVTKPFSAAELLARVRAALRRSHQRSDAAPRLLLGETEIDFAARSARGPRGVVHLTPQEFRLLECLAQRIGSVVPQQELIAQVWGPARVDDSRSLRSYIKMLRQKLEVDASQPRLIITEIGVGYRLCPPDAERETAGAGSAPRT
jgi:two-component system, OmpR family, KDP operon response regulator KdpE